MSTELLEYYHYDDEGWYEAPVTVQSIDGKVLLPDNCTPIAPPEDPDGENFFRWDGEEWETVAKPKTLEDFDGVVIDHYTDSKHDVEMRQILQDLLKEPSEDYREGRGDDLSWYAAKITQEEKDANAAQTQLSDFDSQLSSIKSRLELAMLQGDQETITALQAEYQNLMAGISTMAVERSYCPACGHELDENGVCTNESCPRRVMQKDVNAKQEAAEKAREDQKQQAALALKSLKENAKAYSLNLTKATASS